MHQSCSHHLHFKVLRWGALHGSPALVLASAFRYLRPEQFSASSSLHSIRTSNQQMDNHCNPDLLKSCLNTCLFTSILQFTLHHKLNVAGEYSVRSGEKTRTCSSGLDIHSPLFGCHSAEGVDGVGDGVEPETNVSPEMSKLLADDGSRYRHSPPARGTHVRQLRLGPPHDLVLRNAGSRASPTSQPTDILPPTTPRRPACCPGSRNGRRRHRCFRLRVHKQNSLQNFGKLPNPPVDRSIKRFEKSWD